MNDLRALWGPFFDLDYTLYTRLSVYTDTVRPRITDSIMVLFMMTLLPLIRRKYALLPIKTYLVSAEETPSLLKQCKYYM